MNDIFSRALKIALRTGDKVIVIDPNQPKPYIMLDLEDYESLLDNRMSESQKEVSMQKEIVAETVNVDIGIKKRKSIFEEKISEMASSGEYFPKKDAAEKIIAPKSEMEVEERFFFEQATQ